MSSSNAVPSGPNPRLSKKKNKKDVKIFFAKAAKRETRNVNKDYFGSYSAFGILREMLSGKAGALKVIVVDGSSKMASVATQIAKANGFFKDPTTSESSSKGVMMTVSGM